ncbi:hypothetical protein BDV11DRAFT_77234 [Aspergillus similis]
MMPRHNSPVPRLTFLVGLGYCHPIKEMHPNLSFVWVGCLMISIQSPPQLLRYLGSSSSSRRGTCQFQERICAEAFVTVSHDVMADIITRPYPILSPAKAGITGLAACRLKSPPLPASASPGSPRPGQGCSHRFSLSKTADQEHVYFILCSAFHGNNTSGRLYRTFHKVRISGKASHEVLPHNDRQRGFPLIPQPQGQGPRATRPRAETVNQRPSKDARHGVWMGAILLRCGGSAWLGR